MEQTVIDSRWWACRFDGSVSNEGRFCYWCGRARVDAERTGYRPQPVITAPRVHVVVGGEQPWTWRVRRWLRKVFHRR